MVGNAHMKTQRTGDIPQTHLLSGMHPHVSTRGMNIQVTNFGLEQNAAYLCILLRIAAFCIPSGNVT